MKLQLLFATFSLLSFLGFSQTKFSVKYSFDTDYSGVAEGAELQVMDAVFGGSKLGSTALVKDDSAGVVKVEIVKNNATNYSNLFSRFDIRAVDGSGLLITEIIVKHRSDEITNSNFYRIGSTTNRVTPRNNITDQSTENIALSDTFVYSSFKPGETVNFVLGSSLFSAFVCARGNTNTTFNWYVDEVEIKGLVLANNISTVLISPARQQQIEIMGGDMERSSDFIQNASNTQQILEWCVSDINMNYFRVRYDKMQEMVEGVKNWSFYTKQVLTMKQIRNINPDIKFLATMRSDYNGYNSGNQNNLPTWIYNTACVSADQNNGNKCLQWVGDKSFNSEKYGVFLADYVEFMYTQGVPIDYIATAKEYTGVVSVQRSHDSYVAMKTELETRGIPVPGIIGPASWSLSGGVSYVNEVNTKNYEDEYDVFSSHNLSNTPDLWDDFNLAAKNAGKKSFNDESGAASGGRTSGAEPTDLNGILATYSEKGVMYNGGSIGEIFFEIWSRGINSETRAVYFVNNGVGQRMRAYYVMKEFANSAVMNYYSRPITFKTSGLTSIAFRNDSVVNLWLVNESEAAYEGLKVSLEGDTIYGAAQQLYWYHPVQKTALKKDIANIASTSLSVDIKAKSLNLIQLKLIPDVVSASKAVDETSEIIIYPNPVSNTLNVFGAHENSTYFISDLSGNVCDNGVLSNSSLNVSALQPGLYFLNLENQVLKILKQ